MRFLLLQNYPGTDGAGTDGVAPMASWPAEDVEAHLKFQSELNRRLTELGELVDVQSLTGPDRARFVTSDGTGRAVVTDGPFPEFKELLAGFRIVDVESEARAIEIAAEVSAAPGLGGRPIGQQIEVRPVMMGCLSAGL
jgi:hypothetical protein